MQILPESNNIFFMTKMLDNGHFLFTYKRNMIKTGEKKFLKPG